jgi:hypothetical protein
MARLSPGAPFFGILPEPATGDPEKPGKELDTPTANSRAGAISSFMRAGHRADRLAC